MREEAAIWHPIAPLNSTERTEDDLSLQQISQRVSPAVTVDEVYALEVLFNNLSNTLHKVNRYWKFSSRILPFSLIASADPLYLFHQDGLIHKDEFVLGLFKTQGKASNILVDKFFQRFDIKQNDVIDFEEFVHSLSVFHPRASLEEKAACKAYSLSYLNAP